MSWPAENFASSGCREVQRLRFSCIDFKIFQEVDVGEEERVGEVKFRRKYTPHWVVLCFSPARFCIADNRKDGEE